MTVDEGAALLARLHEADRSLAEIDEHDDTLAGYRRPADRRWVMAAARRRRFVEVFREHALVADSWGDALDTACEAVGWKVVRDTEGRLLARPGYQRARADDPRFAAEVDAIRGSGSGRPRKEILLERLQEREANRLPSEPAAIPVELPPATGEDGMLPWKGFIGFRKVFFGMDSPWFHAEIVDHLENAAPGSITMILLPPEHGKTTLLEDWISYKLAVQPEFRVIYGSEKQQHGRKVVKRIKNRMHPDGPAPAYVERFGPFVPQTGEDAHPQPWNQDYFDVWRRMGSDERDYNMVALGFGSAVAGTRCDLLVLDDVQSLKSLNLTEKIVDEFRQDWLSRPGSKGRTVIIGTRVGEGDFYEKVLEAGLVTHLVKYPAVDVLGRFLWPENYTPEEYAGMQHRAGPSAWARNYQQQPTAAGDRTFTEQMLREAGDPMLRVSVAPGHLTGLRTCIVGHDPGFGTNAVVVAGVTPEKMVVLDWRVDKGLTTTAAMAQVIDETMAHWSRQGVRPAHLVIEDKYVGQGLFEDEAFLSLGRRYGCSISGHKTGNSKYDDDLGVAAMARSFLVGEVALPGADDDATQRARAALDAELHAWRPNKSGTKLRQDLVMALWFCWMRWRHERIHTGTDDTTNVIRLAGLGRGVKPTTYRPLVLTGAKR